MLLLGKGLVRCPAQAPTVAGSSGPSQTGTTAVTDSKSSSPKKIWTNENISEAGGQVSVVGDNQNHKKDGVKSGKTADPGTVSRIRQDLQKLQAQLDDVTLQLNSFREFQEGETVTKSSNEILKGYTRMPIDQQMSVLKDKKKKLQEQIDSLLDEARKKGIEPGQLR